MSYLEAFLYGLAIAWILKLIFFRPRIKINYTSIPSVISVKQEVINDMIYFWDHNNDEFLAQGKTLDEVSRVLKIRFPDTKFVIVEEVDNEQRNGQSKA